MKLCAVCAAADGHYIRLDVGAAHCLLGNVDDMAHRLDFLAHIVVLVLDFEGAAVGELMVDFAGKMLELALADARSGRGRGRGLCR